MGWFTGSVLFVLIWWVALFAVLPFLARPSADPDPVSGVRGAQTRPFVWRAVLLTTLVTSVVWGAVFGLTSSGLLSFRTGLLALHGNCAQDERFCR